MENYEQKYKAALEWMRGMYGGLHGKTKEEAEKYFPELNESEDEQMRKELHIYLDWLDGRKDCAPRGEFTIRGMIAWLENQVEKKSAEWTDSDEERFQHSLLATRTSQFYTEEDRAELVDWLKSLKQRILDNSAKKIAT